MSKISHARHFSKRQSAVPAPGCTNGAFFKSPKAGDVVDTSQPINIEWDTSLNCFSAQGVDIYLYAPYAAKSVVHAWGAVSYSAGSFQTPLVGSWWNSSSAPIQLQLGFAESGTPSFLSPVPTGPTFSATFNATDFGIKNPTGAQGSTTSASAEGGGIFQTIGNAYKNSGLPKGSIAAAVIVPLIAVAIGIAVYVRFQRTKEAEKRKRWSAAVDKRMSSISTEWKGLPPNAQSEAIRQSIAIMRDSRASVARMSQLYDARPVSTFTEGGQAGVGSTARKGTGVGLRNPGAGAAQLAQRRSAGKSAISFAADTRFSRPSTDVPPLPRPSADTQRGRASRAFHTAIGTDDPAAMMSPTQVGGPTMLGDRDIRHLELSSDDDAAPALSMMHHNLSDDGDFLMLAHSPVSPHAPPTPPSAAHLSPTSATPFTANTAPSAAYGSQPAQVSYTVSKPTYTVHHPAYTPPAPAAAPRSNNPFEGFTRGPSTMMSPDAMLRAYASRDGSGPGTPMAVAHPASPPPSNHGGYMYPALDAPVQPARGDLAPGPPPAPGRTLYAPGRDRRSEASRYSDEDAYGGYGHAA